MSWTIGYKWFARSFLPLFPLHTLFPNIFGYSGMAPPFFQLDSYLPTHIHIYIHKGASTLLATYLAKKAWAHTTMYPTRQTQLGNLLFLFAMTLSHLLGDFTCLAGYLQYSTIYDTYCTQYFTLPHITYPKSNISSPNLSPPLAWMSKQCLYAHMRITHMACVCR